MFEGKGMFPARKHGFACILVFSYKKIKANACAIVEKTLLSKERRRQHGQWTEMSQPNINEMRAYYR